MFRVRNVLALVLVTALVVSPVQAIWAEEKEVPSATEFAVVIPTVTIDVKDAPVSQVLAGLQKQTGVKVTAADPQLGRKQVTFGVKEVPALEALAKLVKLTGSGIGPAFGEGLLLFGRIGDEPLITTMAGPCLLVVDGTPWWDPGDCFLSVTGYVSASPLPVAVSDPQITEVLDAEGRAVGREAEEGVFLSGPSAASNPVEALGERVGQFDLSTMKDGFDAKAPFPRTIKGTITLTFAAEATEVTFDLQADVGQTKKVGDIQITYKGRQEKEDEGFGGGPSYSLSVKGDLSKVSSFTLKDGGGRKLDIMSSSRSTFGDSMEVDLQPDGEAKTVTCQVVLKAVTRTYPFEFKDTPAPEEE